MRFFEVSLCPAKSQKYHAQMLDVQIDPFVYYDLQLEVDKVWIARHL